MSRPLRIEYAEAFYHVTTRGNEKKNIYVNERDRRRFLFYLETAVQRYGAVIHVHCLTNNHYNLLLDTPLADLSGIMRYINGSHATYFNNRRQRIGHLLHGRKQCSPMLMHMQRNCPYAFI
ncbi:MAG: transposase [Deltaproteobacteria bacterium]|nr:transposase [Deltaproteobacteria bacterium]MCL5792556.1 transposase [Deltaproteobacteria bacterium]